MIIIVKFLFWSEDASVSLIFLKMFLIFLAVSGIFLRVGLEHSLLAACTVSFISVCKREFHALDNLKRISGLFQTYNEEYHVFMFSRY